MRKVQEYVTELRTKLPDNYRSNPYDLYGLRIESIMDGPTDAQYNTVKNWVEEQFEPWTREEYVQLWKIRQYYGKSMRLRNNYPCSKCGSLEEVPFRFWVAQHFNRYYFMCSACQGKAQQNQISQRNLDIPDKFTGQTWEDFEQQYPDQVKMLAVAKRFYNEYQQHRGLFLSGGHGSGKTDLLAKTYQYINYRYEHMKIKYIQFNTMIRDMELQKEFKQWCKFEILAVDDVNPRETGYVWSQYFYPVIDHYWSRKNKRLLITSRENIDFYINSNQARVPDVGSRFKDLLKYENSVPDLRGRI